MVVENRNHRIENLGRSSTKKSRKSIGFASVESDAVAAYYFSDHQQTPLPKKGRRRKSSAFSLNSRDRSVNKDDNMIHEKGDIFGEQVEDAGDPETGDLLQGILSDLTPTSRPSIDTLESNTDSLSSIWNRKGNSDKENNDPNITSPSLHFHNNSTDTGSSLSSIKSRKNGSNIVENSISSNSDSKNSTAINISILSDTTEYTASNYVFAASSRSKFNSSLFDNQSHSKKKESPNIEHQQQAETKHCSVQSKAVVDDEAFPGKGGSGLEKKIEVASCKLQANAQHDLNVLPGNSGRSSRGSLGIARELYIDIGEHQHTSAGIVEHSVSDISSSTAVLSEVHRPFGFQPSPSFRQSINASTDGVRSLVASLKKSRKKKIVSHSIDNFQIKEVIKARHCPDGKVTFGAEEKSKDNNGSKGKSFAPSPIQITTNSSNFSEKPSVSLLPASSRLQSSVEHRQIEKKSNILGSHSSAAFRCSISEADISKDSSIDVFDALNFSNECEIQGSPKNHVRFSLNTGEKESAISRDGSKNNIGKKSATSKLPGNDDPVSSPPKINRRQQSEDKFVSKWDKMDSPDSNARTMQSPRQGTLMEKNPLSSVSSPNANYLDQNLAKKDSISFDSKSSSTFEHSMSDSTLGLLSAPSPTSLSRESDDRSSYHSQRDSENKYSQKASLNHPSLMDSPAKNTRSREGKRFFSLHSRSPLKNTGFDVENPDIKLTGVLKRNKEKSLDILHPSDDSSTKPLNTPPFDLTSSSKLPSPRTRKLREEKQRFNTTRACLSPSPAFDSPARNTRSKKRIRFSSSLSVSPKPVKQQNKKFISADESKMDITDASSSSSLNSISMNTAESSDTARSGVLDSLFLGIQEDLTETSASNKLNEHLTTQVENGPLTENSLNCIKSTSEYVSKDNELGLDNSTRESKDIDQRYAQESSFSSASGQHSHESLKSILPYLNTSTQKEHFQTEKNSAASKTQCPYFSIDENDFDVSFTKSPIAQATRSFTPKSILNSGRKKKMHLNSSEGSKFTPRRIVEFSSPKAAEYNRGSPSANLTPMPSKKAKALYLLPAKEKSPEYFPNANRRHELNSRSCIYPENSLEGSETDCTMLLENNLQNLLTSSDDAACTFIEQVSPILEKSSMDESDTVELEGGVTQLLRECNPRIGDSTRGERKTFDLKELSIDKSDTVELEGGVAELLGGLDKVVGDNEEAGRKSFGSDMCMSQHTLNGIKFTNKSSTYNIDRTGLSSFSYETDKSPCFVDAGSDSHQSHASKASNMDFDQEESSVQSIAKEESLAGDFDSGSIAPSVSIESMNERDTIELEPNLESLVALASQDEKSQGFAMKSTRKSMRLSLSQLSTKEFPSPKIHSIHKIAPPSPHVKQDIKEIYCESTTYRDVYEKTFQCEPEHQDLSSENSVHSLSNSLLVSLCKASISSNSLQISKSTNNFLCEVCCEVDKNGISAASKLDTILGVGGGNSEALRLISLEARSVKGPDNKCRALIGLATMLRQRVRDRVAADWDSWEMDVAEALNNNIAELLPCTREDESIIDRQIKLIDNTRSEITIMAGKAARKARRRSLKRRKDSISSLRNKIMSLKGEVQIGQRLLKTKKEQRDELHDLFECIKGGNTVSADVKYKRHESVSKVGRFRLQENISCWSLKQIETHKIVAEMEVTVKYGVQLLNPGIVVSFHLHSSGAVHCSAVLKPTIGSACINRSGLSDKSKGIQCFIQKKMATLRNTICGQNIASHYEINTALQMFNWKVGRFEITANEICSLQCLQSRYDITLQPGHDDSFNLKVKFMDQNRIPKLQASFDLDDSYPNSPLDMCLEPLLGETDVSIDSLSRYLLKNARPGCGYLTKICDMISVFLIEQNVCPST
mmetsp:Transcript_38510/g.46472  ORF Transcript_38510/g.46472 Transcript_38510/m.46472 type:complete len:1869 (+) Transcript_38510:129-5735(+)